MTGEPNATQMISVLYWGKIYYAERPCATSSPNLVPVASSSQGVMGTNDGSRKSSSFPSSLYPIYIALYPSFEAVSTHLSKAQRLTTSPWIRGSLRRARIPSKLRGVSLGAGFLNYFTRPPYQGDYVPERLGNEYNMAGSF